jgi:hypothetical protein
MKKLLLAAALALPCLAASGQTASAWSNSKFSRGFNREWTRGGNCCMWGLWKSCPPPCCPPCPPPCYGPCPWDFGGGFGYDLGYNPPPPAGVYPVQYGADYTGGSGFQPVNYYPAPAYWYGQ